MVVEKTNRRERAEADPLLKKIDQLTMSLYKEAPDVGHLSFNKRVIDQWYDPGIKPREADFIPEVYGPEEVYNDLLELKRIKEDPEYKPSTKKSIIAEYSVLEGFGSFQWLPEASINPCTKYDDIKRKVDFVLSFKDEKTGEFYHLGIDATVATDISVLRKKLQEIEEDFERGRLRRIKYFRADMPEADQGAMEIPLIVLQLNLDDEAAMEIMDYMTLVKRYRTERMAILKRVKDPKEQKQRLKQLQQDKEKAEDFIEAYREMVIDAIKEQLKANIEKIKKIPLSRQKKERMIAAHEQIFKRLP